MNSPTKQLSFPPMQNATGGNIQNNTTVPPSNENVNLDQRNCSSMVDTITQSLKGYLTNNLHLLTNDLRQNLREDLRQEVTVALEQTDEPLSIGDRASYYKPIEDTCSGSGVSSKISHTHNITALINDSGNHNGKPKEAVKNPGNGEPSKTQESQKWRSLEGAKAPSESHDPKKPRIETNNNDRIDL